MKTCVLLFLFTFSLTAEEKSASSLVAQALELLQKSEKTRALKLLERAFESSTDSEELRQISVLILEASPASYAKREGYLQYLIKFAPENEDAWRWYKEMGDRSFDKGKMDEAEDWYLRAKPLAKDPSLVQYKLAWVYWNLNRKVEAFQDFLTVFAASETGLQSQILKDLSKLWWEIGALPDSTFQSAMALPEAARNDLLEHFIHSTPSHLEASTLLEAQLLQLKANEYTKSYFYEGLRTGFKFKAAPCFLFNVLITPEDEFSKDNFLACLKSKDRPSPEKLLSYFEKLKSDPDERLPWAQAELYAESERVSDAVATLFQYSGFEKASSDYLKFSSSILVRLNEEELKKNYDLIGPEKIEIVVRKTKDSILLERLQSFDSERWLAFEESESKGKTPTKHFLLKKGVWLATKSSPDLNELDRIFAGLIKPPLKGDERLAHDNFARLQRRSQTKLPEIFSDKFKIKYDEWLSDLDQSLNAIKSCAPDWQIILRPLISRELDKNVEALIAQIERARLDAKVEDVENSFQQKKESLKSELRAKYGTIPLVQEGAISP